MSFSKIRRNSRVYILQLIASNTLKSIDKDTEKEILLDLLRSESELGIDNVDSKFVEVILNAYNQNLHKIKALISPYIKTNIQNLENLLIEIAITEGYFTTTSAPKVAINEYIEISKIYGGNSSYKAINGILGKIYKDKGETPEI